MIKHVIRIVGSVLLGAFAFSMAMQPAPAGAVSGAVGSALTQAVGGQLPEIAKIVAEKLGVTIPESAAGLLTQVGKSVTGEVADASKLAQYGLRDLKQGAKVSLENQGDGKLQVKDQASGKATDIKMSDLFGAAAKLLK